MHAPRDVAIQLALALDRPVPRAVRRSKGGRESWTFRDEDLRAAIPECDSISAVIRRLGGNPGGAAHKKVTSAIARLGLDTSHMSQRGHPPRQYTAAQLRAASAEATSLEDLCLRLRLKPHGTTYASIRRFAEHHEIDLKPVISGERRRTHRPPGGVKPRAQRFDDEEVRRAVADSKSFADAIRLLGEVPKRSTYGAVQDAVARLGIDTSHFRSTNQGRRSYSADEFRSAVEASVSYADVCRRLGLVPRGGNYQSVRQYAAKLGVDLGHLEQRIRRARTVPDWLDEATLRELLPTVRTLAEALRALGRKPTANHYRSLRLAIEMFGVDINHIAGQGWSRGLTFPRRRPIEEYLVDGRFVPTAKLRQRLIEEGLKEARCERCRTTMWQGHPIPLELDHVNGRRDDNRFENLRLLCPNCHALTPTYRGRNIGKVG